MLARLRELSTLLLNFIEQAHILDGDHRLIGKRRAQFDLFRCKGLRHSFSYENDADNFSIAQEWSTERGAITADSLRLHPGIFRVGENVRNVNDSPLQRGSPGDAASFRRHF